MKRTQLQRRTPLRATAPLRRASRTKRTSQLRTRVDQPNSVQRTWCEMVRDLGSILSGPGVGIEIHHPVGRTGRHAGVHIGHWWLLPLTHDEHQGPQGIHARPHRKRTEQILFERVLVAVLEANHGIPDCYPPADVRRAIREYSR